MKLKNTQGSSGFSLLEALVAMVIISVTAGTIYTAINNNLFLFSRIDTRAERLQYEQVLAEFARLINPLEGAEGEMQLPDGFRVTWQAEFIQSPELGVAGVNIISGRIQNSNYQVALAELNLSLWHESEEPIAEHQAIVMGYQNILPADAPIF